MLARACTALYTGAHDPAAPQQPAITIRSARAAELLNVLTRDGRSQAQVIEEALERMPRPEPAQEEDLETWMARLEEITTKIAAQPRRYRDIKEFDAHEYDERGLPR